MWFSSKFERPAPPARPLARPRLYARLRQWQDYRAVFVHAPAGYGKSMLVRLWLDTIGGSGNVAWLSLDQEDRSPVQFASSFAAAIEPIASGSLALIEPLLEVAPPDPARALTRLLEFLHLRSQSLEQATPWVVVLDDYHQPLVAPDPH